MKIIWSENASETVKETAEYIQKEIGTNAKKKFMAKIAHVVSVLKYNPLMGIKDPYCKNLPVEYRSVRVSKLNRIVYYIWKQQIVIAAFRDCRRDPDTFVNDVI
ncbi:MAG: type II toxin-antitoxin system RelE/ParE family toxin [Bacteroidales bacterium]|nr:type II toxin-antitoxin system RelE/ParE family toxin [Bacteroidales bacterium]